MQIFTKIFLFFFGMFYINAYVFNNIKVKQVPESKKIEIHFSNQGTATLYSSKPKDINIKTNPGSVYKTPHTIVTKQQLQPKPWHTTRQPEVIETKQQHDLAHTMHDQTAGLIERDKKGEFIEVEPEVVLRMIQELKKYQLAKGTETERLHKELNEKRSQDLLRDKMDKETSERQQKIQELKQKILALKEKIEEQSAMQLTDKIIDQIEEERKQLVKMLNELKGIEEEKEQEKPDSFFDQFLEDQSVLLEQLEKKIEDEKKKLDAVKQQIEYMQKEVGTQSEEFKELLKKKFILENLIKDLLQQKVDILKKIKLEKEKQEKLEQIQKMEEDIEKKIQEMVEEKKEEMEGKSKEKDPKQEALDEIENIMNETDATEVEEEQQEQHKQQQAEIEDKQEEVNHAQEELKEKEEEINHQEQIVINDKKIIDKDEAQEQMNDGLHDELIEDAEAQKEKLQKINEQIKEKIRQKEEIENMLQERLRSKIPLKHQLDITLNPFYHMLQGVLDKDYADTSNFDQYQPALQNDKGPQQLKRIIEYIQQIQGYFDHLFGDIPATPQQIPTNTDQRVEESLVILDQSIKFVKEFDVIQEQVNLDLEHSKLILSSLDSDPNQVLDFYDLTDEYFLAMQRSKDSDLEEVDELKQKIQDELESFDTQVQQLQFKLEELGQYENKLVSLVQKLKGKIPLDEVELKYNNDKREFYKTERLEQLDEVMKIIPLFVETKMDIDEDLADAQSIVMEIQRNKGDIRKFIKDIDIEMQKHKILEELEKKGEDITENEQQNENLLQSKVSIKMIFMILLNFIVFQINFKD